MNMVWDCDYCKRVNPCNVYNCIGCGSPRFRSHERYVDDVTFYNDQEYDCPYFEDGGVSIRRTPEIYGVWL